jgi:hypothetical protein
MRNPIPKPGHKNNTAKFTVEFSDGLAVAGYLFTDGIAPAKTDVIPGYAWIGGEFRLPGTGKPVVHAPGRAHWLDAARSIRRMAGRPGKFTSGTVTVKANPGHGTREATTTFIKASGLLAALEDALALAGWTLITGAQGTAAERRILADAGLRPETDCKPAR